MKQETYKKYMLLVLMLTLAFNNVDRVVLGVVQEDIKSALHLSDTQLGLLGGIAFALFYSLMGVPIARWADRGDRVMIVSITAAAWSAMVAMCALATNFVQLLLIRVGVAVGEAGGVPPAHSLIADYFSRGERPRAAAYYMQGVQVAMIIGYFGGGWLSQAYGWRTTFVIIGVPGLALAALAWLTLSEPRRRRERGGRRYSSRPQSEDQASVRDVIAMLWANRAFRHLLICFSVWYFFGFGLLQWQPTFFIRSHGLDSGEVGTWFAVIYGFVGAVGVYVGGVWASRYAAGNEGLQLRVCASVFTLFAFVAAASFLVADYHVAFLLLALGVLAGNMCQGPMVAAMQTLVTPRMRAMSIALVYLCANLIGLGLGPLMAGALSDLFRPWAAQESLRYALLLLCPGWFWAAWHLWRAAARMASDVPKGGSADGGSAGMISEMAPSAMAHLD